LSRSPLPRYPIPGEPWERKRWLAFTAQARSGELVQCRNCNTLVETLQPCRWCGEERPFVGVAQDVQLTGDPQRWLPGMVRL
jgi:hypothetical protein